MKRNSIRENNSSSSLASTSATSEPQQLLLTPQALDDIITRIDHANTQIQELKAKVEGLEGKVDQVRRAQENKTQDTFKMTTNEYLLFGGLVGMMVAQSSSSKDASLILAIVGGLSSVYNAVANRPGLFTPLFQRNAARPAEQLAGPPPGYVPQHPQERYDLEADGQAWNYLRHL